MMALAARPALVSVTPLHAIQKTIAPQIAFLAIAAGLALRRVVLCASILNL